MLDCSTITTVTFDCYGTLVDWEAGLLGFLRPRLPRADQPPDDESLLAAFAEAERRIEAGPYLPYREVLARVTRELAAAFSMSLSPGEAELLADSLPAWPAFPDSAAGLARLRSRFRVGVISNVDADLFAGTCATAGLEVDWVVTAQACRSYKPNPNNFTTTMRLHSLHPGEMLHVASSIGHDIEPASRLHIRSVWLDRRNGKTGSGANGPGEARPTMTANDFRGLLKALGL